MKQNWNNNISWEHRQQCFYFSFILFYASRLSHFPTFLAATLIVCENIIFLSLSLRPLSPSGIHFFHHFFASLSVAVCSVWSSSGAVDPDFHWPAQLRSTWSRNMEQAAGCTSITRTQPSRIQASAEGSSVPALIQCWQQLCRMIPSGAVVTLVISVLSTNIETELSCIRKSQCTLSFHLIFCQTLLLYTTTYTFILLLDAAVMHSADMTRFLLLLIYVCHYIFLRLTSD